jgi:transposase
MLLILDNLQGHRTTHLVLWMVEHGVMPIYTPVGGSWLNMTESIQAILKYRAFNGETPQSPEEIIDWVEAPLVAGTVTPPRSNGAANGRSVAIEHAKDGTHSADPVP